MAQMKMKSSDLDIMARNTKEGKKKLHALFIQYKKDVYPLFASHTFEEWLFVHWPNGTMQIKSVYQRIVK